MKITPTSHIKKEIWILNFNNETRKCLSLYKNSELIVSANTKQEHFRIQIVSHKSDGFKRDIFNCQELRDPAGHGLSQKQWVGLQCQYWERDTITCKTVRFQLLKRRINYLYKQKPCAVLSHSRQAIIWLVQWCVYQINNKALNCPVSNFQEKGKYNAFCLLVLFYTVEKNMVIITQLHYIGFHWLWTLDAPTLTSDSKNIISISTAMQILCSWCSVCINCFCFDLCKNVCFWKASSSLVRDVSLIAYANEIYLDH